MREKDAREVAIESAIAYTRKFAKGNRHILVGKKESEKAKKVNHNAAEAREILDSTTWGCQKEGVERLMNLISKKIFRAPLPPSMGDLAKERKIKKQIHYSPLTILVPIVTVGAIKAGVSFMVACKLVNDIQDDKTWLYDIAYRRSGKEYDETLPLHTKKVFRVATDDEITYFIHALPIKLVRSEFDREISATEAARKKAKKRGK